MSATDPEAVDAGAAERPIAAVVKDARAAGVALARLPLSEILDQLDAFASRLLSRESTLHRRYPGSGVPYISQFCRRAHLQGLLAGAFEDAAVLDTFVVPSGRPGRALRAFPRGVVGHWLSGNVPTLGFLSVTQALLTKNASVVKQASDADGFLVDLVAQLAAAAPPLGAAVSVVRFAGSDRAANRALSDAVDARIFWGGDDAARAVRKLPPRHPDVPDLFFPHRTSLAAIGQAALSADDLAPLARRLATDISAFEQRACASPHTVFVETDDPEQVARFGDALHAALERVLRRLPRGPVGATERSAILNARAEYDMFWRAWSSKGLEHTLLHDDLHQLGPPIGGRTVFVRAVPDLMALVDLMTPQVQSVGLEVAPERFDALCEALGAAGAQRFARLGTLAHFDAPWDGVQVMHGLVRWAARSD